MHNHRIFPVTLVAAAILSGCGSIPQNASLTDAHSRYDSARADPQVSSLAAVELKDAGDSLSAADYALSKRKNAATVDQLAYIATQKVAIAQEIARRKADEIAVTNATAKRDQIRLEARTAEADAAKQQVAIVQATADQQAAALATASVNATRDQARIDAKTAEADAAKRQAAVSQGTANQQAAALATANANAARDQARIAQQEMQLTELNAKKTERGLVITLGDVLFSSNKSTLKSGGVRNVQKLADFLKQYPQHKVLIEGYTDSIGSDSFNLELSDRRANAVRMALTGNMGIDSNRVATHGYGEEFPVASNDTADSRQLNRRVEIILSDNDGNIAPR